jgi:tetratricopeptide (TPR) repeat protein
VRSLRLCIALAGAGLLSVAAGPSWSADDEDANTVRDLAYGEVLFHFFQDDHFTALTRLLAAQTRNELPSHEQEAELLLGGLYLSYGQHRLAGEIFERLLAENTDTELHDRAWFFLAKIWQQRGYLAESEAALARIVGELPRELEPERQMLHAQVLMEQQRFDEALTHLENWRRPRDEWVGYTKFNIGVALVRLGRVEEGTAILGEVGQMDPENPALDALRDKANVALGYAWLQASRPIEAKPSLQRVRLQGPYSNKALLGVGWSDAEQQNYRAALTPWIELRNRDLLDSAVQESLLAVPYAFAQLGADAQAADYYVDAIEAFTREMLRLDASMEAILDGDLIDDLLNQPGAEGSGWYWRVPSIPRSDESRYLYELMSTHRFQEGLKTYRDLVEIDANLRNWTASLGAFDDILDTKQRAYEQRLPLVNESLARIDLDGMARSRVALESRLLAIERTEDVVALGTRDEQQLWQDLAAMEPKLALLEDSPRTAALRQKQRFLKGLLMWDLRRDYSARVWAEKKSLRDLDRQIKEAQRRHHQVETARSEWPEQFAQLTSSIEGLAPRVAGLRATAGSALDRQQAFLQGLAVDELQAQRARLNTYMVQARFALAAIYDRAAATAGVTPDSLVAEGGR